MKIPKIKALYDSKYFWMALSLLASVLLWVYITSTEDTIQQQTYTGVPVTFTGEDTIRKTRGLIISDVDATSVTVRITGNRRALGLFSRNDLQANINVGKITQAGEMRWTYDLAFPAGVDTSGFTYEFLPDTINFTVEKEVSKTVPVKGVFSGSSAEGYVANSDTMVFEPAAVTIYGTEAELEQISYAAVTLTGEDIHSTITENLAYDLVNDQGEKVPVEHVLSDVETIATTLTVNTIKELPIDLEIIYGGGATASNTTITVHPQKITLSGEADELENMTKYIIGSIDLSDYAENTELTIPLELGDGVQCLSGETEIKVSIKFDSRLETKTFDVEDLQATNIKDGYHANIVTKTLSVVIRADSETLSKITPENIHAVADLSNYQEASGTVKVPVTIHIDGVTGAGAVGDYNLTINLTA